MRQALADASVNPDEVDYVNAHATSTPVGDQAEARVLATVFGEPLCEVARQLDQEHDRPSSDRGRRRRGARLHRRALQRQAIPPTINLHDPDPECRLLPRPQPGPERTACGVTVSNSFGFGGSNTCLVLRAA